MDILRHRPDDSNVEVVQLERKKTRLIETADKKGLPSPMLAESIK
jgi:hypothetical protein